MVPDGSLRVTRPFRLRWLYYLESLVGYPMLGSNIMDDGGENAISLENPAERSTKFLKRHVNGSCCGEGSNTNAKSDMMMDLFFHSYFSRG